MVLLKAGWEHEYDGSPAIYPIGCSGEVSSTIRAVGRRPVQHRAARCRAVSNSRGEPRSPLPPRIDRAAGRTGAEGRRPRGAAASAVQAGGVARAVHRPRDYGSIIADRPRADASAPGPDPMIPAGMADEELVNALAQYLDLEPIEKQALLERQCLRSRRIAGRAARNEADARTHARRFARRALSGLATVSIAVTRETAAETAEHPAGDVVYPARPHERRWWRRSSRRGTGRSR